MDSPKCYVEYDTLYDYLNRKEGSENPGRMAIDLDGICNAVCDIRSIGEQSGRTAGRLGSTGLQAMPPEGRHSWHSESGSSSAVVTMAGLRHSQR